MNRLQNVKLVMTKSVANMLGTRRARLPKRYSAQNWNAESAIVSSVASWDAIPPEE